MQDAAAWRHIHGQSTREQQLDGERSRRFEQAFDACAGRVFAYAARRSDPETASDVVGETFLIAWRKLDDVPAEPLPWLLNVARKVLANRRRSDERRVALTDDLGRRMSRGPARDHADALGTRLAVLEAIERLPPSEREAITLVAWDGLDVGEGALAAGCSRATFSVRLHRARRRLMKELGLRGHPGTAGATTRAQEARPR